MDENPTVDPAPPPIHKADALPPVVKRVDSNETERPPSAQQRHDDRSDEHSEFMSDDDPAINDPAHRLPAFDWEDLHARYHAAISKCQGEEDALMQEFQNLMTYFRIWAESGHVHETNRTYHRLQTRSTYVRHAEDTLEQKRNHYVNVVKAFESALNLLKASSLSC